MFPIPEPLASALEQFASGDAVARLVVRWPDGTVRQVFEEETGALLDGSVTYDRTRTVRRSAELTLRNDADGSLSPTEPGDLLAQDAWVTVERGARIDGEAAYVPLIDGRIRSVDPSRSGTIGLGIEDHLTLAQQPMGEALAIAAGSRAGDAIVALIGPVLPAATWVIDDAGRTLGASLPVAPEDDRLEAAAGIARDLGLELLCDRMGRLVVRPRPDPTAQPVARRFPWPVDLVRHVERRVVNRVMVVATPGDAEPIVVVDAITDELSPLHERHVGIRMADVIRTDLPADAAAARAFARSRLAALALSRDGVDAQELPVLDLEEADVVEWEERISRTIGRFRIDRLTVPVTAGMMTAAASRVVPLWAEESAA